jgi:hypothetical protein
MKNRAPIIMTSALLSLAVAVFLWWCSRGPQAVVLPTTITTVAAGYPFALQVKNQMAGDAHLTTVVVDIDREGSQFKTPQIVYGFASPKLNGRVFAITVDNVKHEAFAALDVPNSPDNPYTSASRSAPLDLSSIAKDIPDILDIAKTNGLDEFCMLASPTEGNVSLGLFNSQAGPVWNVTGDGWDEKGPIADLAITVDARTGAVLAHTLQQAVNRP